MQICKKNYNGNWLFIMKKKDSPHPGSPSPPGGEKCIASPPSSGGASSFRLKAMKGMNSLRETYLDI